MDSSYAINYDRGREFLKWIAIITMTLDHIGLVLYPQYSIFRIVGRISFPLFAYLLVLGIESTRNLRRYFYRLFFFALISQIPFSLANGIQLWEYLNIFFTLALGLKLIYFLEKNSIALFIPLIASIFIPVDYGGYGVASVLIFYLLRKDKRLGVGLFILINIIYIFFDSSIQPFSLIALPLILLHNDGKYPFNQIKRKTRHPLLRKYFFYIYYPLHLMILALIKIYY